MNCQRGRLLGFLLANSWVRQNSGSIELYFLFYFRMDCGWIVGSAEAKNRRKEKIGQNSSGSINRSLWLIDQTVNALQLNGVVRSIGCSVRSIEQVAQKREVS